MIPEIIIWVMVFAVSLYVLIRASSFFTDAAEHIGLFFGIPHFIIGVTIVAVGTSLPEIIPSIFAVLGDASEIVIGNVIGSNIANVFLVLGLVVVLSRKIYIKYEIVHIDLPLLLGSTLLLAVMVMDGSFSLPEAFLCLAGFAVYLFHALTAKRRRKGKEDNGREKQEKKRLHPKYFIILVVSAAFIYFGAKYTIDSVIRLSELLHIGKEVIAASAIAVGTSLPEMTVSIIAAKRGKPEIAIGNVLGSNIFNVFAVMGIPALFGTLIIPQSIITFGLPMLLIATFLFVFMTQDREVKTSEGLLLLLFYAFFIGKLFRLY
jgi:cation:H+ antiporter